LCSDVKEGKEGREEGERGGKGEGGGGKANEIYSPWKSTSFGLISSHKGVWMYPPNF